MTEDSRQINPQETTVLHNPSTGETKPARPQTEKLKSGPTFIVVERDTQNRALIKAILAEANNNSFLADGDDSETIKRKILELGTNYNGLIIDVNDSAAMTEDFTRTPHPQMREAVRQRLTDPVISTIGALLNDKDPNLRAQLDKTPIVIITTDKLTTERLLNQQISANDRQQFTKLHIVEEPYGATELSGFLHQTIESTLSIPAHDEPTQKRERHEDITWRTISKKTTNT